MASSVRKNDWLLRALGAVALGWLTWAALHAMPFYPAWLTQALALGTGAVALLSPGTASVVFVLVLALPVLAADLVVGVIAVILGLLGTQYLSEGRAEAFLLTVIGIALVPLHAEWAAVAVAGYLLGRRQGAVASAAIVATLVFAGMVLGVPVIGATATGGHPPAILHFTVVPKNALSFAWVIPAAKAADPGKLFKAFGTVGQPVLVVAEIALWAIAGALGSVFRDWKQRAMGLAGAGISLAAIAGGSIALQTVLRGPVAMTTMTQTLAISLPVALAATALAIWVFPRRRAVVAAPGATRDVDDLLRTIASAEDELAARHSAEAVVLITDMKSFSAMTDEVGSVESAKVVQRHRDLLLPIVKAHKGCGTSTGGDGLVAAFRTPADAVAAAIEMQKALEGYTGSDRSPHELSVRVGIASGEVVVDKNGCPFLGAALNLAARVMDLADGGRIMVSGVVAAGSGADESSLHSHGDFKLKNIAEPVGVVEVLWRDGVKPQEIRAS